MKQAMLGFLVFVAMCLSCVAVSAQEYVAGVFTTEGEPLPHATVAVLQPQCSGCEECAIIWQGEADHEGGVSFELPPLPPGEYSSRIFAAKAQGYAPSFRNEQQLREQDKTRLLFGLQPIVRRNTGTVLNDKGEPVTNAEIGFFTGVAEPWRSMSLYCPEFWGARTDAEGRFSYELTEKGRLCAYVLHPDYARELINLGRIAEDKPRPAPVTVSMMPGRVLYGWVKSGSPVAPAANAVVRVKLQPNCKCGSRTFQTTADEEGYYAFMGLPLGPTYARETICRIRVEHPRKPVGSPDSWRGDVRFTWPPGQLAVMQDVYFEEGVTIEGRVVNGLGGEPISSSRVKVDMWDTVQARKDGTFCFAVQPGVVRLEIRARIDGEWQVQHKTLHTKEDQDISGLEIVFGETAKPQLFSGCLGNSQTQWGLRVPWDRRAPTRQPGKPKD